MFETVHAGLIATRRSIRASFRWLPHAQASSVVTSKSRLRRASPVDRHVNQMCMQTSVGAVGHAITPGRWDRLPYSGTTIGEAQRNT